MTLEVTFNEQGDVENWRIAKSDDPTGDQLLERIAIAKGGKLKLEPHLKDGQPVKFKTEVPFNFPVEGDEGPTANEAHKPRIRGGILEPDYPADLLAKRQMGGAILELLIKADGSVSIVRVLRASHPEFGQAAEAAVRQWHFWPELKDGKPVESRWRMAVSFAINNLEPDWIWRVAPRPSLGGFVVARVFGAPAPTVSAQPSPAK